MSHARQRRPRLILAKRIDNVCYVGRLQQCPTDSQEQLSGSHRRMGAPRITLIVIMINTVIYHC